MSHAVLESPIILPDSRELPRKLWTRDECHKLMRQGYLEEGRYELIEGEIILKMGQNEPHVYSCTQVYLRLIDIFGRDHVRLPAPVALNTRNEPEPDVSVVTGTLRDYLDKGTPKPEDMRLVVEVSDSTLRKDMGIKARVYARSGISDYWIVNLKARTLIIHRAPQTDGYQSIVTIAETDTVSPLAAPTAQIQVSDLLP